MQEIDDFAAEEQAGIVSALVVDPPPDGGLESKNVLRVIERDGEILVPVTKHELGELGNDGCVVRREPVGATEFGHGPLNPAPRMLCSSVQARWP